MTRCKQLHLLSPSRILESQNICVFRKTSKLIVKALTLFFVFGQVCASDNASEVH
jgi:hypothetical protein